MKVQIHTRYPLTVEADADEFGAMFAKMNSEEQIAVFRAMITHMAPHKLQWDYVSLELDKPENDDVCTFLKDFTNSFGSAS